MIRTGSWVIIEDDPEQKDPLVLRDIGPWTIYKTITNDAENVVARLVKGGGLPEGRRLFYFDPEGELSELLVKDGQFAGFGEAVSLGRWTRLGARE